MTPTAKCLVLSTVMTPFIIGGFIAVRRESTVWIKRVAIGGLVAAMVGGVVLGIIP